MSTKSLIIENATRLFQQKGYKGVGLSEILKTCDISKGALYHHFPNGKEELLIACLQSLNSAITSDIEAIYETYPNTLEATNAMIKKLIIHFETEGTIAGFTISSIVSEMASFSEPVRKACAEVYEKIEGIYFQKLVSDGLSNNAAKANALMLTASIEGAMMLCLTQNSTGPLKVISQVIPNILKEI